MRRIAILLALGLTATGTAAIRLPTNRAAIITVGPLVDVTDGVTPMTSLTVTGITAELFKDSDAGAAPTRVALTLTTSGGGNDMVHITDDTVGCYSLELTASQLNFTGRARLVLMDIDAICPWWVDLVVEPNSVYDSQVHGSGYLPVDVQTVAGETPETSADIVSTIDSSSTILAGIDTKIGTPSVDLASDVAAVKSDTAAILIDTGIDGVVVAPDSKTGYSLSSPQTFDLTGNITGSLSGSVGSVTGSVGSVSGAVGSVTAPVTVGVNNDKNGYALTSAYDAAKTALTETAIVDGTVTIKDVMECLLAFMCGRATITDNGSTWTIQYYKRDNTTVKFNITASEADGGRAAAGTVNP